MRSAPSSDGELLAQLTPGDQPYIIGFNCGWYKDTFCGDTGYIRSDLLELTQAPVGNSGGSMVEVVSLGQQVVDLAQNYLGYPYVWGASTPSGGFDCSGFVKYVYAQMGYTLNRVAADQMLNGSLSPTSSLAIWCSSTIHTPPEPPRATSASTSATTSSSTRPTAASRSPRSPTPTTPAAMSARGAFSEHLLQKFFSVVYKNSGSRTEYLCDFFFIFSIPLGRRLSACGYFFIFPHTKSKNYRQERWAVPLPARLRRPADADGAVDSHRLRLLHRAQKAASGPRIEAATIGKGGIRITASRTPTIWALPWRPQPFDAAAHFADTGLRPQDYDLIVTGDLGMLGSTIVTDLFQRDGVEFGAKLPRLRRSHLRSQAAGCSRGRLRLRVRRVGALRIPAAAAP